jgi:SAM-dependent methyltransferase
MTTSDGSSWRELNRAMWNAKVPLHLRSELYNVAAFKAGALSLRPQEIEDVGDVAGRDLIHLQCHFGKDTLSWARLGARATGLDFSQPAIEAAVALAREIGVEARFVNADVYDAPAAAGREAFDIVYTGVGALCWLPDIDRWARVVFDLLRPGGQLYLFEFHPMKWIFAESTERPEIRYDYFTPPVGFRDGGVTYADVSIAAAATPTVQWNHPLGEVVTALATAGLRIALLREMDGDVLPAWKIMQRGEDRLYRMPPGVPALPQMYVLRAFRDA